MVVALAGAVLSVAVAVLAATFFGYPLVAAWLARRRPTSDWPMAEAWPRVLVIVAARNEARHLEARLQNLLALDYPKQRLSLVVASDGSTDDTVAIAMQHVAVLALPAPVGKTQVLIEAVRAHGAGADVLAFTDATAEWPADALRWLVAPLADPAVGAVSGLVRYRYTDTTIARGFRAYQQVVVPSRAADARVGWTTSVSGSISAVRAALFEASPPELSYDLMLPVLAARHGLRAVVEPRAVSWESARSSRAAELESRIRLAASAYAFIAWTWRHRRGLPAVYIVQLVGQKIARWLAPLVALLATVAAVALAAAGGSVWPAGAVGLVVALGLLGRPAPLHFGLVVALAYVIGLWRYVRGERIVGWEPESQR